MDKDNRLGRRALIDVQGDSEVSLARSCRGFGVGECDAPDEPESEDDPEVPGNTLALDS